MGNRLWTEDYTKRYRPTDFRRLLVCDDDPTDPSLTLLDQGAVIPSVRFLGYPTKYKFVLGVTVVEEGTRLP